MYYKRVYIYIACVVLFEVGETDSQWKIVKVIGVDFLEINDDRHPDWKQQKNGPTRLTLKINKWDQSWTIIPYRKRWKKASGIRFPIQLW